MPTGPTSRVRTENASPIRAAIPIPIRAAEPIDTATVVMITMNRRDEAVAAVRRLLALPDQPPVIVLDNGSDDGTADALTALTPGLEDPTRLRVLALGRNLGAAARNLGVQISGTPIVAFCDDDSGWRAGALTAAARIFADHPRLGLLAARLENDPGARRDPISDVMAASPLPDDLGLPGPPVLGFVACASIVRRRAFLAVGGFPVRYGIGGEEQPLSLELEAQGWGLAYVDQIVAVHRASPKRDRPARRRTLARNRLRTGWSYRRGRAILQETMAVLEEAVDDPAVRWGIVDAIRDSPATLRARRPVPERVEERCRYLDRWATAVG